ncbi:hypothetical protein GYMLUDRAFT_32508 [Collybiopsis luxurians FD-317 M1]|nr:hypothetical protein GYMLUDRAFT_32508 [Collybiopsis luxurians FD-317 M1]
MSDHPRTRLNNWAAQTGKTVVYEDQFAGTQHAPVWTSKVYVNGQLWGRGQGGRKDEARENAARQALTSVPGSG